MKQIIYEIKSQPLIAIVTVIGTSLAIFLIMIAVMLQQVKIMPMAPENDRDRMLYVSRVNILTADRSKVKSSSSLSYQSANELTADLDGVEAVAIVERGATPSLLFAPGKPSFFADVRKADQRIFDVYDLVFIEGKPFTEADVNSGLRKTVITEAVAREAFGSPEAAVGQTMEISDVPYTVTGVIENVSPITESAYAQVWIPLSTEYSEDRWTARGMGSYKAVIKAESSDRFGEISDEINRRAEIFSTRLSLEDDQVFDLEGGPKNQEGFFTTPGADNSKQAKAKRQQWFLYFILLLIPAINLSSMTRSRLRRRTGEIGVRRAFGCTRSRVIYDILLENFLITLVGGFIGLMACIIFGSLLFDAIYSAGWFSSFSVPVTVSFGSLFDWRMFAYALLFCFVLNLFSTGIPAWRASRVNPVDAINSRIR